MKTSFVVAAVFVAFTSVIASPIRILSETDAKKCMLTPDLSCSERDIDIISPSVDRIDARVFEKEEAHHVGRSNQRIDAGIFRTSTNAADVSARDPASVTERHEAGVFAAASETGIGARDPAAVTERHEAGVFQAVDIGARDPAAVTERHEAGVFQAADIDPRDPAVVTERHEAGIFQAADASLSTL